MLDYISPNFYFERYSDITPEFLLKNGIKTLLLDVDNTLAPYEQPLPDERITSWFDSLKAPGISCALISNNHKERVELFNASLGLLAYYYSKKPGRRTLLFSMEQIGSDLTNTAAIGDQLLTDALGAHRLGIPAFIFPPIRDKKNLFFRFKRMLEKPYIKKYNRENKL